MERSKALLERLPGFDYDPSAAALPEDEEPYPDDSVSQIDYGEDSEYGRDAGELHAAVAHAGVAAASCLLLQSSMR